MQSECRNVSMLNRLELRLSRIPPTDCDCRSVKQPDRATGFRPGSLREQQVASNVDWFMREDLRRIEHAPSSGIC